MAQRTTLISPVQEFFDPSKGRALAGGTLYIGAENSDPKNDPLDRYNVYNVNDDGSEILISQPIPLNGAGQPSSSSLSGNARQIRVELPDGVTRYCVQAFSNKNVLALYQGSVAMPTDNHALMQNRMSVGAHDDIYIRARTLSEAIAEDAPAGTRYTITDRGYSEWVVNTIGYASDLYINKLMPSGRVISLQHNGILTPKSVGWIGDGTTPQADIVEFTFNTGFAIDLNCRGAWLLEREINLPADKQPIVTGLGCFPVYPYEMDWYPVAGNVNSDILPTFLVAHSGSDAFRIRKNGSGRGLYWSGFNIVRLSGSCIRGIGFDLSGTVSSGKQYPYGSLFERVGIFDFESACDAYVATTSTEPTAAAVTFKECVINRNGWITRNLNGTAFNGFFFHSNKAGQQSVGGLNISAHSFNESDNFFEGTPNPVKVVGAYEGVNVGASYFEANTGSALYSLQSLRGPVDVRPCTIIASDGVIPVRATNVSDLRSVYPVIGEAVYNLNAPNLDGTVNRLPEISTDNNGISICNRVLPQYFTPPRLAEDAVLVRPASSLDRGESPLDGLAMVIDKFTTNGVPTTYSIPITAPAGKYLAISFMLRHTGAASASTYLSVNLNGSGAVIGSRDYGFGEEDLHIGKGEWKLYTVCIKSDVNAATSISLAISPYGVGNSGQTFELTGITAYACDSVNSVKPYISKDTIQSVGVAPTTGTWQNGDTLRNVFASGAGTAFWLYVSGTGWVNS